MVWRQPFRCAISVCIHAILATGLLGCGSNLCVWQCPPNADCDVPLAQEFETYPSGLDQLRTQALERDCSDPLILIAAGTCLAESDSGEQAMLFLHSRSGDFSMTWLYDATTKAFVSWTSTTGNLDLLCSGVRYWQFYTPCEAAEVAEVVCGIGVEPGEALELP